MCHAVYIEFHLFPYFLQSRLESSENMPLVLKKERALWC